MRPLQAIPNEPNPDPQGDAAVSTRQGFAGDWRQGRQTNVLDREDELTLLDYWRVIYNNKFPIAGFCTAVVAATLLITLQMPKIFESTVTLLPQLESNTGVGLNAILGGGIGSAAQSLGVYLPGSPATSTDIFVAILKSRIMADDVIRRFNLLDRYRRNMMQDARVSLEAATRITVTKEKALKITVEDTDPQLAADIANFYASNLDRLNQTLSTSKARENRKFIEQRFADTESELVKAENGMKEFQTQNRTVAIEAQSKAMMEAAATVQAQIMAQEVQLQVMGSYLSTDNPEVARVRSSISELRKQLRLMHSGKEGKEIAPNDRLHPTIASVPALALEYGRLARDLKVQETLHTLLMSQYEEAKLAEARDTPTVEVLDPAIPAERKSRPRISYNVMLAGILSLLFAVFVALVVEAFKRRQARLSPQASLS